MKKQTTNPLDLFVKRPIEEKKEDNFIPPFELESPINKAPSVFEVDQLYDDGDQVYVVEKATVIAESEQEAIQILKEDDPDEKRRQFWSDGVVEASSVKARMIGWATGENIQKGIVAVLTSSD